jgi:hypothetical protein
MGDHLILPCSEDPNLHNHRWVIKLLRVMGFELQHGLWTIPGSVASDQLHQFREELAKFEAMATEKDSQRKDEDPKQKTKKRAYVRPKNHQPKCVDLDSNDASRQALAELFMTPPGSKRPRTSPSPEHDGSFLFLED